MHFKSEGFYLGNTKIYIKELEYYTAEAYYLYGKIRENQFAYANHLKDSSYRLKSEKRKSTITAIIEAMIHNLASINEILETLEPHVLPKELLKVNPNPTDDLSGYLKDYHYLKRDWGGDKRSEFQLKVINDTLRDKIKYSRDSQVALFLGAGTGRIAFDLADNFSKIYLTDKSFSMAWHFEKIKLSDISFYEINLKNTATTRDQVKLINASLNNAVSKQSIINERISKMNYFVSDVLDMPLRNKSVNYVYSIYFSDIIALRLWFPEVKRILTDQGQFIHFGPLDYFFDDQRESLSCSEVADFFEKNGFRTRVSDFIETEHLPSENRLSNKTYKNWFFVAEKEESSEEVVSIESILNICERAVFQIKSELTNNDTRNEYDLIFNDGEVYGGAESVFDLLKEIDGETDLEGVFEKMSLTYGDFSHQERIKLLNICQLLVNKGVLSIKK